MPPEQGGGGAIVLAAQREGERDPLAAEAGTSHKCLVLLQGKPLIRHVLDALADTPGLARIRICVEPAAFGMIEAALAAGGDLALPVDYVPAAANLADSVYASARGLEGPLVITTADNVLLTPGAVEALLAAHGRGAEVAIALTTRDRVLAAHPEGQRRFYRLADDSYSNCNLYGLSGERALRAAETFRTGGQFAKNPGRLAFALGIFNLLLLRFGRISLDGATRRLSRRLGLRIEAILLADGSHAIDVDNARTYKIAEALLARRPDNSKWAGRIKYCVPVTNDEVGLVRT